MAGLTLTGVRKTFGKTEVIKGIDLTIDNGEFVVFVGPSGCGKSTLLRMISGLEDITGGTLDIDATRMNDVPPAKRGVAMVFQSYALYPHLNVRDNMGFGLKVRKTAKAETEARVAEAADTLQLGALLDRYPRELSGGQRQRVAIGRAIVGNPEVFLFDEPLSNLDAELRVHMRAEIAGLHQRLGNTMVYVTHDQIEAMTLADKIVVLRDGLVEQVGSPRELYERPCNSFVAQFIGSPKMNIFEMGSFPADLLKDLHLPEGCHTFGLRPEHIRIESGSGGLLPARIRTNEYTGAGSLLHLDVERLGQCIALYSGGDAPAAGTDVRVGFDHDVVYCFDDKSRNMRSTVIPPG